MKIIEIESKEQANFPILVQVRATENWSTVNAFPGDSRGEAEAWCRAEGLAFTYPSLPIRIVRCVGGPIVRK